MNKKHYTTPAVVAVEIEEQSVLATSDVVVDTTTGADDSDVLSGSFDGVEFDWDKEAWQ